MRSTFFLFLLMVGFLICLPGPVRAENGSAPGTQQISLPAPLQPQLASDGKVLIQGVPLKAVVVDPNPLAPRRKISAPARLTKEPQAATASFSITYVPNGGMDPWNVVCETFPENAKAAFNAAATIWANTITSTVPITIRACWASLASPTILGYSGGGGLYRDFTGAKRTNTWYTESLANSLYGADLGAGQFDMHITYNKNFAWYYGTDGNTPMGQYDLMTVVLHEIAHGLNFSGSMDYAGGIGSWGYGVVPAYPDIYDVFMRDGGGTPLINYLNGSAALGSALISNNIWFHGAKAMAANGNQRVKMYAPGTWTPGSSYTHLDHDIFNDTSNQLMVWAVSDGESVHDPGVITRGLFQDIGWTVSGAAPPSPSSFPWAMFLPAITAKSGAPSTPASYWSALSYVYCPSSSATFSLTSGGITKKSVMPAGGGSGGTGTFEGWVTTTPGARAFSWQLTTSTCGSWIGNFSYTLQDNKNYMFSMELNAASQPTVYVYIGNGVPNTAANTSFSAGQATAAVEASMKLIDTIPLAIPAEFFKSTKGGLPQGSR